MVEEQEECFKSHFDSSETNCDEKEIVKLKKKRSYTIKADGTTIILYEDGTEVITNKNGKLISVK